MFDLRPLRSAGFRPLAATYSVNEFGNWVGEVALAILVLDRTKSPLATAALFLAMRLVPSVMAPPLTAHLESLSARHVLGSLYLLESALFVCMAALTRNFSLPLILVLVMVDGAAGSVAKALTRAAVATDLMPQGLLREGNALINLVQVAAAAAGPALAGVLVAWKGTDLALLADALSFVVAASFVLISRHIRIESDLESKATGRMRAGLEVVRSRPVVRKLIVAFAVTMMLGSIAVPVEVVFAKSTLHAGDTGYGALLAGWGVGMVIGGLAFLAAAEYRLVALFGTGTLGMALGYAGLAASPSIWVACIFSAIGGIGNGAAMVSLITAVQERIPAHAQGTVGSLVGGLDQVMPGIGFLLGGAITALSSPRIAYAVSAAGLAIVVLGFSIWRIDQVQLSDIPLVDSPQKADALSDEPDSRISEIESIPDAAPFEWTSRGALNLA
jgi:MFS family permease